MKARSKHFIITSLSGAAAGFANGLLGAGGGMLAVPILKRQGLSVKSAHANSVAVIMPLSLFSAVMYLLNGSVNLSDAYIYVPWGILGAAVGTLLLKKLPDKWIKRIFAAFMIWAGVRLMLK